MGGHDKAAGAVRISRPEDVEHLSQIHSRLEVISVSAIREDCRTLHVTTLADVELSIQRKLAGMDDRVVDLPGRVDDDTRELFLNVQLAGAMASLTIDTVRNRRELVLRAVYEAWDGVVARHTGRCYRAAESVVVAAGELRREVPFTILRIPRHWHLVEIPVLFHDVRIRVLAGPYDVVDFFDSLVDGVPTGHAILHDEQLLAYPKGLIVEVESFIVDRIHVIPLGRTMYETCFFEGTTHLGLGECLKFVGMA